MGIEYLKRAGKTPETETANAQAVVVEMLAAIRRGGEQAVRDYARTLDKWTGDIVVSEAEIEQRTRDIPAQVKGDIEFATAQVRRFALAQRESVRDFSVEMLPGHAGRAKTRAGRCRRLLRADRSLCAYRVGLYVDCDSQSCRRAHRDCMLGTLPRRGHPS